MTWSRQEPIFPWHPKVMGLSDAAFRLCVTARDYATLMQTEGFIGERLVPRLLGVARKTKRVDAIVAELTTTLAGEDHPLWERVEGGYRVHDYLVYNLSRGQVEEHRVTRESGKVAGGKARAAGAERLGGRFVKRGSGADPGHQQDQQDDQQPPARRPAESPAATSTVTVSDSSIVEDNVNVNAASPAEDHQQTPAADHQRASDALVMEMLDVLGDQHSAALYRRIAARAPDGLVYEVLAEVKYLASMGRIRKSRGAVFTDVMKREGRKLGLDLGFGVVAHAGAPPRRGQRPVATVSELPVRHEELPPEEAAELRAALDDLRRRVSTETRGAACG